MTEHSDTGACFHCGETIIDKPVTATINDQTQLFCCPACASVAEIISEQGFGQYYKKRDSFSVRPVSKPVSPDDLSWLDLAEICAGFVSPVDPTDEKSQQLAVFQVEGIHCAACCWLIEQHLLQQTGISKVQVSLQQQKASVQFDPEQTRPSQIAANINELGYIAKPWQANKAWDNFQQQKRQLLKRLGVAGLGMMQVGMCAIAMYAGDFQGMELWLRRMLQVYSMIVTAFVLVYSCQPFFASAWRGISQKKPGMDVPVSLAMGIAFLASVYNTANYHTEVYFDAVCMFAFFLLLARYIELLSRSDQLRDRARLVPDTAWRYNSNNELQQVASQGLQPGDSLLLKAGDQLAADGYVIEGQGLFDESAFSGESVPVQRGLNAPVFAGSVNQGSAIKVKVTATGNNTRIEQISNLLDKALLDKPRISQLADRISVWFIAVVLMLATLTALYWGLVATNHSQAFVIVLSVLVVSCPCALSLATPVALASSSFFLKKQGLAIRSALFLETLPAVDTIVFDKTGTLTRANLAIHKIITQPGFDKQQCLALLAAMEQHSNHPLAEVFKTYPVLPGVETIREIQGQGMEARFENASWRFGKTGFALEKQPPHTSVSGAGQQPPGSPEHLTDLAKNEQSSASVSTNNASSCCPPPDDIGHWLLLSCDGEPAAWLDIRDSLRAESPELVKQLQQHYPVSLLSGDQQHATATVAKELGITDFLAGQTAEDKVAAIRNLQQQGKTVLMVGDGINDAPVMAQADVSIAVAEANDLSKLRADAHLLGNLLLIPVALQHARKTRRIIRQNLVWALVYNFSAIPLAMAGMVPPWLAAIGMSLSSVLVCLNANRLDSSSKRQQVLQNPSSTSANVQSLPGA